MPKITKLLIANRGEIAVRIIRAAKDAGIPTVAIYADQDRNARHTRLAHEAYALNGNTSAETYLVQEKILAIAKRANANAIHPGYGFLAENAGFAQAVIDDGLIWIGPSPTAIDTLGDKVSARKIALQVGAPLAPGTDGPVESAEEVSAFAKKYGLPVAIKAAYGGGGRGLKVARTMEEIPELFDSATREAVAAFGRGECFVEKFLERPRHVETQCLADHTGKVVVISTRDCSLQRRHQKLVEEAPAPFLSVEQEKQLYDASKAILKEAKYVGAGTCEFLIGQDGTISFLEVNTRLQVEHPVSEEITGIDLVCEQFRIAEGETLDYDDPKANGHSLEFRINGEDPGNGFLPMPGPVHTLRLPGGPGVRVDSGVTTGDVVTGAFDSLLAKLIVTGKTRQEAIDKSRRALGECEIAGLPTVLPFHRAVLEEQDFVATSGERFMVHTTWIEDDFSQEIEPWSGSIEERELEQDSYRTIVVEVAGRRMDVSVPGKVFSTDAGAPSRGKAPGRRNNLPSAKSQPGLIISAPMQSRVVTINARVSEKAVAGEIAIVLEAMKMEQPLRFLEDGMVMKVLVTEGETVKHGQALVILAPVEVN